MQEINSSSNPRIQHIRQLADKTAYRRKHAESLLEGIHLIESALKKEIPLKQVFLGTSAEKNEEISKLVNQINSKHIYLVPDRLFDSISTVVNGPKILAVIDTPQNKELTAISSIVLDRIQDAGNAGTILRTAAAAGIKQIISLPDTVDLWSPKVLRAGMGAHFALNIIERAAWQAIAELPLSKFATSSYASCSLYDLDLYPPHVWIFGNEGQGIAEDILQDTTQIKIPQPGGEESLNVASAAAVCIYEGVRQQHK